MSNQSGTSSLKLEASGIQCGGVQQFFSTHPCPDNRIANITSLKVSEGCTGTGTFDAEYANFKNLIQSIWIVMIF